MRRWIWIGLLLALFLSLWGCSQNESEEATVIRTFSETPEEQVLERMEQNEEVVLRTYREWSDGTWETDAFSYLYKLTVSGRLHNAAKDTTYTILSNIEEITFEQAWKASGLSSHLEDYFQVEDAVFVAIQ